MVHRGSLATLPGRWPKFNSQSGWLPVYWENRKAHWTAEYNGEWAVKYLPIILDQHTETWDAWDWYTSAMCPWPTSCVMSYINVKLRRNSYIYKINIFAGQTTRNAKVDVLPRLALIFAYNRWRWSYDQLVLDLGRCRNKSKAVSLQLRQHEQRHLPNIYLLILLSFWLFCYIPLNLYYA